ncbi:hypothetical protein NPIL_672131 [Nephila pilipes]|uniref:Uncharacterized protein n=1 Tax=Nephila pilipes TaxID=299642 RepID=A0A8X6TMR0_NEPPI|nr:hypothetical protein NPIL_672131 [Nephila pilipes]
MDRTKRPIPTIMVTCTSSSLGEIHHYLRFYNPTSCHPIKTGHIPERRKLIPVISQRGIFKSLAGKISLHFELFANTSSRSLADPVICE